MTFNGVHAAEAATEVTEYLVFVGTYTGPKSQGIYSFRFNSRTGEAQPPTLAAEVPQPAFLALHPNGRYLYCVNETGEFQGAKTGALSAFAIDPKAGTLTLLNQTSSGGGGPCHLLVHPSGRWVLTANYGGGSFSVTRLEADGRLGDSAYFAQHHGSSVNPDRQKGPHAHGVTLDAGGQRAFVPDLGLDQILVYRVDLTTGTWGPNDPPSFPVAPGSGPRHFTFAPDGKHAYVINEMLSTITAFRWDAAVGQLQAVGTYPTLPAGFDGRSTTAEIEVHPSGRFVYGSNRGHDSLAVFARDPQTGKLTLVQHVPTQGRTPRAFGIEPQGRWLWAANQASDQLVLFRLDPGTGMLQPTDRRVEVGSPVSLQYLRLR